MRTLPARVQRGLERLYGLDAPPVDAFIRPADEAPEAAGASREALLLRDSGDDLEIALVLPRRALEPQEAISVDEVCQVVEGVSHFLYVVERARRRVPTTQLELELQAEVDKFVVLVGGIHPEAAALEPSRARSVRTALFHKVRFSDPPGTERGDRYRLANRLAARWTERLERRFARGGFAMMRGELRHFHAADLCEKIELARAA
jgi:hypothetical protein